MEVDETYFGGKRKNLSNSKRMKMTGRGQLGKTAFAGVKNLATKQVGDKTVSQQTSRRCRVPSRNMQRRMRRSSDEAMRSSANSTMTILPGGESKILASRSLTSPSTLSSFSAA